MDLLYYAAELNLKAEKSLIMETNFNPKFADKKFLDFKEKYNFAPFQVRCITNGEILLIGSQKRQFRSPSRAYR